MATPTLSASRKAATRQIVDGKQPRFQSLVVHAFVLLPMLALVAAVPLAWGWGLTWLDVGLTGGSTSCPGSV
jgi:stearoyl-CoA desaturase (Delta-9 desaturase)